MFWYKVSSEGWRSLVTVWVGLFSGNHGENFASVAQVIRVGLKRSLWEAWGVSYGFGESDFATVSSEGWRKLETVGLASLVVTMVRQLLL